ncbi:hypothetical protein BD413DRAFT_494546 [Trametes elegans]|nr:hypothetical protein BD413DRAFT_494546 [Trametes elegans]
MHGTLPISARAPESITLQIRLVPVSAEGKCAENTLCDVPFTYRARREYPHSLRPRRTLSSDVPMRAPSGVLTRAFGRGRALAQHRGVDACPHAGGSDDGSAAAAACTSQAPMSALAPRVGLGKRGELGRPSRVDRTDMPPPRGEGGPPTSPGRIDFAPWFAIGQRAGAPALSPAAVKVRVRGRRRSSWRRWRTARLGRARTEAERAPDGREAASLERWRGAADAHGPPCIGGQRARHGARLGALLRDWAGSLCGLSLELPTAWCGSRVPPGTCRRAACGRSPGSQARGTGGCPPTLLRAESTRIAEAFVSPAGPGVDPRARLGGFRFWSGLGGDGGEPAPDAVPSIRENGARGSRGRTCRRRRRPSEYPIHVGYDGPTRCVENGRLGRDDLRGGRREAYRCTASVRLPSAYWMNTEGLPAGSVDELALFSRTRNQAASRDRICPSRIAAMASWPWPCPGLSTLAPLPQIGRQACCEKMGKPNLDRRAPAASWLICPNAPAHASTPEADPSLPRRQPGRARARDAGLDASFLLESWRSDAGECSYCLRSKWERGRRLIGATSRDACAPVRPAIPRYLDLLVGSRVSVLCTVAMAVGLLLFAAWCRTLLERGRIGQTGEHIARRFLAVSTPAGRGIPPSAEKWLIDFMQHANVEGQNRAPRLRRSLAHPERQHPLGAARLFSADNVELVRASAVKAVASKAGAKEEAVIALGGYRALSK